MSSKDTKALSCIGLVAGLILGVIFGSIISGWVLAKLWLWFLVPLGAPVITMVQAIGFALVFGLLTSGLERRKPDKSDGMTSAFISALVDATLTPLMYLGIGWIVYQFI